MSAVQCLKCHFDDELLPSSRCLLTDGETHMPQSSQSGLWFCFISETGSHSAAQTGPVILDFASAGNMLMLIYLLIFTHPSRKSKQDVFSEPVATAISSAGIPKWDLHRVWSLCSLFQS